MAACRFCLDPLRAKIIFNTSYEKFDLSTYVLVDNTLFNIANFDALKYSYDCF